MTKKSLNYYGFDADTYRDCLEMISRTNSKHLLILNSWFIAINLFYIFFSISNLFGVTQEKIPFYAGYFIAAIAFEIVQIVCRNFLEARRISLVYLNILMMLSYGILASVNQPYMPATIFLVFYVLVFVSYISSMTKILLMMFLSGVAFLLSSYMVKTFSIAYYDTYNFIIVSVLALGLHYTYQKAKMQQFTLYLKNLQIQRELEVKSSFDALTSLLNRARFISIAEEILRRRRGEYTALCLLDLDGFKEINDVLGHQMGDKAIQVTGKIIAQILNLDLSEKWNFSSRAVKMHFSFAGRLGGDEFIIFIEGCSGKDEAVALIQKILVTLNKVKMEGIDGLHASFGVTQINDSEQDIDGAYKRADLALYESKRAGKNQISYMEDSDTEVKA